MDRENKVPNYNYNDNDEAHDIESDGKDVDVYSEPLLVKRRNTTSQIAIVGANVCPIESLDYE